MVDLRSTWSLDERRRALVSKLSIGQVGGLKKPSGMRWVSWDGQLRGWWLCTWLSRFERCTEPVSSGTSQVRTHSNPILFISSIHILLCIISVSYSVFQFPTRVNSLRMGRMKKKYQRPLKNMLRIFDYQQLSTVNGALLKTACTELISWQICMFVQQTERLGSHDTGCRIAQATLTMMTYYARKLPEK